jgi:F-type H+-transporting ATPase subunit delta
MSNRTSAARYARALFDVALEQSDIAQVDRDLAAVVATIDENPELGQVLTNPGVPDSARRNIIGAVAARLGVTAPVAKLLALIAERHRLDLLPDVASVYRDRLLAHQNIVEATVTTALPLSPDATSAVQAGLAEATGKHVEMKVSVDPSLLGGVVARVGSTVYDGSVRTQLEKMRDRLVAEA